MNIVEALNSRNYKIRVYGIKDEYAFELSEDGNEIEWYKDENFKLRSRFKNGKVAPLFAYAEIISKENKHFIIRVFLNGSIVEKINIIDGEIMYEGRVINEEEKILNSYNYRTAYFPNYNKINR